MERIRASLVLLLAAAVLTLGQASGLDGAGRLVLTTSDGASVVGVGTVGAEGVGLTLVDGFSGFGVLVFEAADGSVLTFDVAVTHDGRVMVTEDGGFVDLAEVAARQGLALHLTVEAGTSQALSAPEGAADERRGPVGAPEVATDRAGEAAEDVATVAEEVGDALGSAVESVTETPSEAPRPETDGVPGAQPDGTPPVDTEVDADDEVEVEPGDALDAEPEGAPAVGADVGSDGGTGEGGGIGIGVGIGGED